MSAFRFINLKFQPTSVPTFCPAKGGQAQGGQYLQSTTFVVFCFWQLEKGV